MRRIVLIIMLVMSGLAVGQNLSLHFTSLNQARFFLYVNGKLQNEQSVGMITVNGLEDKEYHIRVVIDDPYVVAVTKTIRPTVKHREWTVEFNAVKERVYLREANTEKTESDNGKSQGYVDRSVAPTPVSAKPSTTPVAKPSSRNSSNATPGVNKVRTNTIIED